MDALVERLIDRLKSLGEYENTVIVLFGDHGDFIGKTECLDIRTHWPTNRFVCRCSSTIQPVN